MSRQIRLGHNVELASCGEDSVPGWYSSLPGDQCFLGRLSLLDSLSLLDGL